MGGRAASQDSDAGLTIRGLHAARRHRKESASAWEAPGRVRRANPCAAIRSAWPMTAATRKGMRSATQIHRRTGIAGAMATAPPGPASRFVKDALRHSPSTEPPAARSPKGTVHTALPAARVSPVRSPVPATAASVPPALRSQRALRQLDPSLAGYARSGGDVIGSTDCCVRGSNAPSSTSV
jgi:hypothetical protein